MKQANTHTKQNRIKTLNLLHRLKYKYKIIDNYSVGSGFIIVYYMGNDRVVEVCICESVIFLNHGIKYKNSILYTTETIDFNNLTELNKYLSELLKNE